jgi:precorrin-6A/cobalt-precorrin-6A reductase
MRLLVLGGTAEGRSIADALHSTGLPSKELHSKGFHSQTVDVVYSVAGIVRIPKMRCRVISGGFSQFGGLKKYLLDNNIDAVVDATHPYAVRISNTASAASIQCNIPCWRYQRPPWLPSAENVWHRFNHWGDLAARLRPYRNRFLTVGQPKQRVIDEIAASSGCQWWLRTAVKPKLTLPANCHWINAIGPFSLDNELMLMHEFKIDVLISKNSGGEATVAKIKAAKQLSIPVFILDRPMVNRSIVNHAIAKQADLEFSCPQACIEYITHWIYQKGLDTSLIQRNSVLIRV